MIQITITLDEIGYSEILDKLAAAGGADPDSPAAALLRYGRQSAALLPERAKEALAVQLLSQNQARLWRAPNSCSARMGFRRACARCMSNGWRKDKEGIMKFEELGLSRPILNALRELGYVEPTPIQRAAIPAVLAGRDVLGLAQTGTGKTCAFAAPILQNLARRPVGRETPIRALVVTPTRELAIQIAESFDQYGRHLPLKNTVIFGGVGQEPQVRSLREGVDILTATPGRLLDLHGQGYIDLTQLEVFVLDEADRMLDMGFIHDVRRIIQLLPEKRQTLFFSATMPQEVAELVDLLLHDPVRAAVDPVSSPVDAIEQSVYFVDKANKQKLLLYLIERERVKNALVFTRTKHGANRVADYLVKNGVSAAAIHGNKSQTARQAALSGFKDGSIRILVATDIAARGLDISGLSHAFNFDLPDVPETYVHRIGRTGRAGREGTAIAFCCIDEMDELHAIEKLIGRKLPVVEEHPYPMEVLTPTPKDKNGRPVRTAAPKQKKPAEKPAEAKEKTKAGKEKSAKAEKPAQEKPDQHKQGGGKKKKTAASAQPAARVHGPVETPGSYTVPQFQVAGGSAPQEIRTLAEDRPVAQPRSGGRRAPKFDPAKLTGERPVQQTAKQSAPKHVYARREERPAAGDTVMDATARFLMPRAHTAPRGDAGAKTGRKSSQANGRRAGGNAKKRQG